VGLVLGDERGPHRKRSKRNDGERHAGYGDPGDELWRRRWVSSPVAPPLSASCLRFNPRLVRFDILRPRSPCKTGALLEARQYGAPFSESSASPLQVPSLRPEGCAGKAPAVQTAACRAEVAPFPFTQTRRASTTRGSNWLPRCVHSSLSAAASAMRRR
jgi:hypothetical protein